MSSSSSSSFSDKIKQESERKKKYRLEMLFYDKNTCSRCLKQKEDKDLKDLQCLLLNKNIPSQGMIDRLCTDCHVLMKKFPQIIAKTGNEYIDMYRKFGEHNSCSFCISSFRWLMYMNSPGESTERCGFCKVKSKRSFLRVYRSTDVCVQNKQTPHYKVFSSEEHDYMKKSGGETKEEFERRFHLCCMDCYKNIQEQKKKGTYDSCKACENGLDNMCNILTFGKPGTLACDGETIINMNYLLNSADRNADPKYTKCARCDKAYCDVNYCYLYDYKCTECEDSIEASLNAVNPEEKNRHAVCKDCAKVVIEKIKQSGDSTLRHAYLSKE